MDYGEWFGEDYKGFIRMNLATDPRLCGAGGEPPGGGMPEGKVPIIIRYKNSTKTEGIAAQTEQSCKNVAAILEAAGSGMEKVFKTTCFLANMSDFAAFNEVYAKYFVSKPGRSCVAVKDLPKGVLCEIEAVAVK